jgi:hypothetical protein
VVAKLVKEFDSGKINWVTHVVAITPRGVQSEGHTRKQWKGVTPIIQWWGVTPKKVAKFRKQKK